MERRKKAQKNVRAFSFLLNNAGIDEDSGVFTIQPSSADYIQNMHPEASGEYSAHNKGFDRLTAQLAAARIDSMYHYREADGSDHFLVATDGDVKDIDPGDGSNDGDITTANTAGNPVRFTTFLGSAYMVEKTMTPYYWNGTTLTQMTVFASGLTVGSQTYEKPSLVATYANRAAFADFNGSTAYASHVALLDTLAADTFTSGASDTNGIVVQVNPGDGQRITALQRVFVPNLNNEYLLCFKDQSVWALSGDTPNTVTVFNISPTYGAVNQESVIQVGTDVLFLSDKDVYSVTTSTSSGNLQPIAIGSKRVRDILGTLNLSQKTKSFAVAMPDLEEIWFAIPTGASTEPDTVLVYSYRNSDLQNGQWIVRTGHSPTCGITYNTGFYSGDSSGYINRWFSSSMYEAANYTWVYRYPYFNFGTQNQVKRVVDARAIFRLRADTDVTVKTEWRGGGNNTVNTATESLSVDSTGAVYGTAVYGTDTYSDSDVALVLYRFPVFGDGLQVQFEVSGNTSDTGAEFLGIEGEVEFGGFNRRYN